MARLLVALDTDENADDVVASAIPLAQGLSADVVLLHVLPLPDNLDEDVVRNPAAHPVAAQRLRDQEAAHLPAIRAHGQRFTEAGLTCRLEIARGEPAAAIVDVADDLDAHLIVIGTHGHQGLVRLVLGSVAEEVLRSAHVPVVSVRLGARDEKHDVPHHEVSLEGAP